MCIKPMRLLSTMTLLVVFVLLPASPFLGNINHTVSSIASIGRAELLVFKTLQPRQEKEGMRIKLWESREPVSKGGNGQLIGVLTAITIFSALMFPLILAVKLSRKGIFKPEADKLFLPLKFHLGTSTAKIFDGYLRRLDSDTISIICQVNIMPGTKIFLEMGKLPGFPEKGVIVNGVVKKSVKSNGKNSVVTIKITHAKDHYSDCIIDYIDQLHPSA